jgi:hypothetical protein
MLLVRRCWGGCSTPGWSLLLPAGWVGPFWQALTYAGEWDVDMLQVLCYTINVMLCARIMGWLQHPRLVAAAAGWLGGAFLAGTYVCRWVLQVLCYTINVMLCARVLGRLQHPRLVAAAAGWLGGAFLAGTYVCRWVVE